MTKKIGIKKIETNVPYDAFISSIDGIALEAKRVNFEVYFTSKKIYELEDTMFVILNMYDNSGEMKALLVGEKSKDFVSLVDNIKHGLRYRISGNVSVVPDETDDVELPFMNELRNNKLFCIYALQCYSDTIYGIDLNEFNGCIDVEEEYEVIAKYTDYLKGISKDEVKYIAASCYGEIVVLLNDGTLFVNGKKKLDNINMIQYINSHTIIAISNNNVVTCLTERGVSCINYLNNNNYMYKKIVVTEFGIAALRYDGVVVYFGDVVSSVIDYSRFIDVDDIDYEDGTGGITIIKDGKNYSLFHYVENDD